MLKKVRDKRRERKSDEMVMRSELPAAAAATTTTATKRKRNEFKNNGSPSNNKVKSQEITIQLIQLLAIINSRFVCGA